MIRKIQYMVVCLMISACSMIAYADITVPITAITIPSADVVLSFVQPGRIVNAQVKDGDSVKKGQVLVQLDAAAEKAQLAQIEAASKDTTQIEAAQYSYDQKKIDLKRLQWAAERGSATELEVEHAILDVKIAELSLKVANFEHEQNQKKYKEAGIRVDNMTLKSPIAGYVEKIRVENGESVNGLEDVVRVVKTDPLWIDVHVPVHQAKSLKMHQKAQVRFPDGNSDIKEGAITYISTVADAASTTLRIRIELPNKSNRPAGEHVKVLF